MIKKIHQLITEFIVLVPHAIKEIRNKSDEIAHTILIYYQVINFKDIFLHILIKFNIIFIMFVGRIRASN